MRTFSVLTAVIAVLVLAPEDVLAQDDLSGEWILEARNDADILTFRLRLRIDIVQDGQTLTATSRRRASDVVDNWTGTLNESDVRLQFERMNMIFTGTLADGSMSGSFFRNGGTGIWAAERGVNPGLLPTSATSAVGGAVGDPAGADLPNPNPTVITEWGPLPDGRTWGTSAGVDIGPDGNIWAYDRCGQTAFADVCSTSDLDPILKFDRTTGEVLTSFGAGLFVFPHGIHVDSDGNVWITDSMGNEAGTKGHQVIKFSPGGEVLMTLGQAGVAGDGPDHFNEPNDVITAPNGDIFVADGHSGHLSPPPPGATARIMKFTSDGQFIKEWGGIGDAPGEFRTPHALAFDSRGRLFVADRGNNRLQIFDQDGNFIDSYVQFSRISDLFIDDDDTLYAVDSESNARFNPGWLNGIRIGNAAEDRVTGFIPPHWIGSGPQRRGVAGEGVAVDAEGNVYVAEGPISRPTAGGGLTKYLRP